MSNHPAPLIQAPALQALLQAPGPLALFDCSFDLADPAAGERQFESGHVPGAHYLHLEKDLSDLAHAPGAASRGRHPLPTREAFAATLAARGVTTSTHVVVYDRQGAMYAARAWWMLRWLGHARVSVLDGGWSAWAACGGAVSTGASAPRPAAPAFPVGEALQATIDATGVLQSLGRVPLIDARAPERYRGEVEPLDPQAGHIPGALNRCFKDNLAADGCFKSVDRLRADWAPLLGRHAPEAMIHQCGSGVTACHNLLALAAAGWPGARLYPGSWSEWSSDASRPVARSV